MIPAKNFSASYFSDISLGTRIFKGQLSWHLCRTRSLRVICVVYPHISFCVYFLSTSRHIRIVLVRSQRDMTLSSHESFQESCCFFLHTRCDMEIVQCLLFFNWVTSILRYVYERLVYWYNFRFWFLIRSCLCIET